MTFKVYKDARKQWRWSLVAENNRAVANSGEGYHNKKDCLEAINLICNVSHDTKFVRSKPGAKSARKRTA